MLLNKMIKHQEIVNYTHFVPDLKSVLISWNTNEVGLLNLETLQLSNFYAVKDSVNNMDYRAETGLFLCAEDDPLIQLVDIRDSKKVMDFECHKDENFAV